MCCFSSHERSYLPQLGHKSSDLGAHMQPNKPSQATQTMSWSGMGTPRRSHAAAANSKLRRQHSAMVNASLGTRGSMMNILRHIPITQQACTLNRGRGIMAVAFVGVMWRDLGTHHFA